MPFKALKDRKGEDAPIYVHTHSMDETPYRSGPAMTEAMKMNRE